MRDVARWTMHVAEAQRGRGEDRVAAITLEDRVIVAVADGAGGASGGAAAAEMVCAALDTYALGTPWIEWLAAVDRRMAATPACGLAAAVVMAIGYDGSVIVEQLEKMSLAPTLCFVDPFGYKGLTSRSRDSLRSLART